VLSEDDWVTRGRDKVEWQNANPFQTKHTQKPKPPVSPLFTSRRLCKKAASSPFAIRGFCSAALGWGLPARCVPSGELCCGGAGGGGGGKLLGVFGLERGSWHLKADEEIAQFCSWGGQWMCSAAVVQINYILQLLLFCNIYSALQKYRNSKDKIALLAVESTYLQIWLKDEWANRAILSSRLTLSRIY